MITSEQDRRTAPRVHSHGALAYLRDQAPQNTPRSHTRQPSDEWVGATSHNTPRTPVPLVILEVPKPRWYAQATTGMPPGTSSRSMPPRHH